jgi:hypothetical protein
LCLATLNQYILVIKEIKKKLKLNEKNQ